MVASKFDDKILKIGVIAPNDRGSVDNQKVSWKALRKAVKSPKVDKKHTYEEYLALPIDEQNKLKDVGSFVGGWFEGGRRKGRSLLFRSFIALDIDDPTPRQIKYMLDGKSRNGAFEFCAYTTRKHTSERPRWRALFPMTRNVEVDEYNAVSRILASRMFKDVESSMDAVDNVSYRPVQIMYWPSIASDGEFDFFHNTGKLLNPDKLLENFDGDWQEEDDLPWSKKRGKVRKTGSEDAEWPTDKKGIIGAFCRVYDVEAAIAEFIPDIYTPGDEHSDKPRYTYLNGTSSNGAVIEDDGMFIYSHHGSDPLQEKLSNAFDMVRIHLFGELDIGSEMNTPPMSLPSFKAMVKMLRDDEDVQAELEEADDDYGTHSRREITFENLDGTDEDRTEPKKKRDRDEDAEADDSGDDDSDLPNLGIFNQNLLQAATLPLEIAGDFWASKCEEWAEGSGAPVDYTFWGLISAVATIIGNARWARIDSHWVEPPVLWTALVGHPSSNKSPSVKPIKRVIDRLEASWDKGNAQRRTEYEKAKYEAEENLRAWKKDTSEAMAAGSDTDDLPMDCMPPAEPLEKRVIVDDATIEGLADVASRNPRGLMIFKDELSGLFDNMTRYSKGSDRPMYLQAFGASRFISDRKSYKGRSLKVPHFFVGMFGGIQPEVLSELLSTKEDGFQARFIYVWPEFIPRPRRRETEEPKIEQKVYKAFKRISKLEADVDEFGQYEPRDIWMTAKAAQAFLDWYNPLRMADEERGSALGNAFGKTYGIVARIALVLEHLWWSVDTVRRDEPPEKISIKAVKAAIRLCEEYIKPMQRRAYRQALKTEDERYGNLVAQWINTVRPKIFSNQDIFRDKVNSKLKRDPKAIASGIQFLLEENWIEQVETANDKRAGRPAKFYRPHKMLYRMLDTIND